MTELHVTLPVGEALTPHDVEQASVEFLTARILESAAMAGPLCQPLIEDATRAVAMGRTEFVDADWSGLVERIYDTTSKLTRLAVSLSTRLAARDALITQNITRTATTVLEEEG